MATVTGDELYSFILANAEEIDGQFICRASLIAELRRRGVDFPGRVRKKLVKELSQLGLVHRPHPRSTSLIVLDPDGDVRAKIRAIAHENFMDRMASWSEPGAIEILKASKHGFRHDEPATRDRLARLDAYFRSNVLDNKRFVCSSWRNCEASISPGSTFKEGQLSHVGKHYDLESAGQNLRIVVVGQEVAGKGKPRTTMDERYARVHDGSGLALRFDSVGEHKRRNPHMRGTTLALRTIFGLPGTNHATEFLYLDEESIHIFDCFALVNRLLCAAHLQGTSTGKSTTTMLNNCERHFRATLEILEPTIVIIQGIKVWKWSKNVLVPVRQRTENLFECELAGRRVMVAAFTHPSAWSPDRWDSPQSTYFKEIVRPTLERAMEAS